MTQFDPETGPDAAVDDWTIALDGGTTNTRARLLHGTRLVADARRAVGVRDTVLGEDGARVPGSPANREGLLRAVREVIAEVGRSLETREPVGREPAIVAAGMLSSEVGLVAVPHVEAPAGLDDLARASAFVHLPEVDDRPILVVPGVRTLGVLGHDGWFASDVMRGEECETLGAHASMAGEGRLVSGGRWTYVWPGSHTKVVEVAPDGRIAGSYTTLAGEILQAIARQTLLAASLPAEWPAEIDPVAAAEGARAADRHGLGRAAFLVRIADLGRILDERGRFSFLIGAVVAADVHDLAGLPCLEPGRAVFVGGREPIRTLYSEALGLRHDGPVSTLDATLAESASALGARAVAERRQLLDRAARGIS